MVTLETPQTAVAVSDAAAESINLAAGATEGAERAKPGATLFGWGRLAGERCRIYREVHLERLSEIVRNAAEPSIIASGLGRSYGDAALNGGRGVVDMTRFDRFLSFDEQTGILECEAGVPLASIVATFLPRGWFLSVTPATKFVTVGGAIAADVHGKNHHCMGSFGDFVQELELMTAEGSLIRCSRDRRSELFLATLGGMGLTGIVLSARIGLARVETAYVRELTMKCPDLDTALEKSEASADAYRYCLAWIDCLARGPTLGRGVLMVANEVAAGDLARRRRVRALALPERRQARWPTLLPGILNRFSVAAFNAACYARQRDGERIVHYDRYFYPLDRIDRWNRAYGGRGFIRYEALLPLAAARQGLIELLEAITASGIACFRGALKRTGEAGEGMLSFAFPGYTLALDIPNRGEATLGLVRQLDEILLRHGGRISLANDAVTPAQAFAAMYGTLERFRAAKRRSDSRGRFSSSLARRLALTS